MCTNVWHNRLNWVPLAWIDLKPQFYIHFHWLWSYYRLYLQQKSLTILALFLTLRRLRIYQIVLFAVFSAMKMAARFLCQTMQENSWNITMASLDWFTAYLVRLFDLSSPCFFQRATCILARQMRPNVRQSDNNIGWQRQAENCKRDDGPTRLAETSSILIAVESPLFLLMRTLFWVTSLFP